MQSSFYALGYLFCSNCGVKRTRDEAHTVEGRGERLFCDECGFQVRSHALRQSQVEKAESRAR